jgi:hypothetical protein
MSSSTGSDFLSRQYGTVMSEASATIGQVVALEERKRPITQSMNVDLKKTIILNYSRRRDMHMHHRIIESSALEMAMRIPTLYQRIKQTVGVAQHPSCQRKILR